MQPKDGGMASKARRQHLHASVGVACTYGMVVGLWLGLRGNHAGWIEWCAFVAVLMFAPRVLMAKVDARYGYTTD